MSIFTPKPTSASAEDTADMKTTWWASHKFSRKHIAVTALIPIAAIVSFVAFGASPPATFQPVTLSNDPLYAPTVIDKPALALSLSVEFPTVGAQYVDVPNTNTDSSYSNDKEYLGYYDAESCYTYIDSPSETPATGLTSADYKRFDRSGAAIALGVPDTTQPTKTSRKCSNAFSGNFLNWASNSAIDMLRLSLTGGDRYIDTPGSFNTDGTVITYPLTILQRAVIPNGDPTCMWNSNNFPAKQLARAGGTSGSNYFGAVPTAMATAAGTNDIWIANTLNRIYFKAGTSADGGCGNTGSYTLGVTTNTANQMGPITNSSASLPGGTTLCASEGGVCNGFTGTKEIWYGANTSWKVAPATGDVTCGNTPFGDPASGVSKKCYYRNYTGSWTPTAPTTGLNSDGYFFSRVQVCNVNSAGILQDSRDFGLCKKYPNGNFKPAGAIQKYSDQLRLAAFGYLMDQTASYSSGRYGGVLRAPMKYVGNKTYNTDGVDNTPVGGNTKKEWNETTGVFIINPESDTTYGKSGVISYLNLFGRTGPVPGRYKKYDPVGELHYETLRYLQGLQPSTDAVSLVTSDMYDGFPAYLSWTDPYAGRSKTTDYSCLKSNIVVIGDVNTHDGNRLPTASVSGNVPNINTWRSVVQNFEKNVTTGTYVDGVGGTRYTGNPNGANNSVPSATDRSQIMGSAYWARTHDIRPTTWTAAGAEPRPGLRVKTFIFDVNENGVMNNDTTRRTANQFFMASKYGGFETDPSNLSKNPYNTWGNPFKREDGTVDKYVWEDTDPARPGEANTYFLLQNPRGVLKAFDDIFARASTAARSIAGGAIQSKNLTQAGDTIYQGTFDTTDWSGDLLAIPIAVSTGNVVSIGSGNSWTAATQLAAMPSPATDRNIIVGNRGAGAAVTAVDFKWATIETDLQDDLNKAAPGLSADGLGQSRLNYLRGDKSKEGSPFRARSKLLGDIINSGVVYSGVPTTGIASASYSTFYEANKTRTPAVFVGANDGMLHAFKATNGEPTSGNELFAYIPSWLGAKLSLLTDPAYLNGHQSYLDGTPTIAEAEVTTGNWKTVLVSGTGAGGQGVFALDVTNPAAFSASNVMWEFTDTDDSDLGNVTGRPQILKMRTSAPGATAVYKWFAVFGSGVNNNANDGHFSTSGKPALFILDLSKAAGTAWTLGTNYYKISLPVDATLGATTAPGLINFRAALGLAREVTEVYMGDLHGSLWKLNFTAYGATDWNIEKLSYFTKLVSGVVTPYPMFIAKDGTGTGAKVQPISAAPNLVFGKEPGTTLVIFGTGKYLEIADKTSTAVQSVYMVYDNGSAAADDSPIGSSAISGRGRLKAGSVNASTGVITIPAFTLGRAVNDTDTSNPRSGWYFDFPISKERQISNGTVFGDKLIFGSLIPAVSAAVGSCAATGGGGNQYTVDVFTGNGTSVSSSVGILGEPLVAELGSAVYTPSDSTGRRVKTITSQVFQQGSNGVAAASTSTRVVAAGRLSWRQINNYQDLKNAP